MSNFTAGYYKTLSLTIPLWVETMVTVKAMEETVSSI